MNLVKSQLPESEMNRPLMPFDNDGTPITTTASELSSTDAVDGTTYSYEPVHWHWFYLKEIDKTKRIWKPFSMLDSVALEDIHQLRNLYLPFYFNFDIVILNSFNVLVNEGKIPSEEAIVPTDGNRYDVDVGRRLRTAIYWEESPSMVRRCSWFFKGSLETRYTPYEEEMAEKLEEEYHNTLIHRYQTNNVISVFRVSNLLAYIFMFV